MTPSASKSRSIRSGAGRSDVERMVVVGRWASLQPRVEAAGGDAQQLTPRDDRMFGLVMLHEFEDPLFVVGFAS
jgi:hypothetical protein